jgi:hypothetical protein
MNEQPEQKQTDGDLQFLNAELAKLIQQEQERQEKEAREAGMEKDGAGNLREFPMSLSHEELHALNSANRMLFQMCAMALLMEKDPNELKDWKQKQDVLLGIKSKLGELHDLAKQDGSCDDDDDDNCDHDH